MANTYEQMISNPTPDLTDRRAQVAEFETQQPACDTSQPPTIEQQATQIAGAAYTYRWWILGGVVAGAILLRKRRGSNE